MQDQDDCTGGGRSRGGAIHPEVKRLQHRHLQAQLYSAAALTFGVRVRDLQRPSRCHAPVAEARQAAMYLAHVSAGLDLTTAGALFARDRTTAAHGCAAVEARRDAVTYDKTLSWMEVALRIARGRDCARAEGAAE
jgi:hypothetical protein